MSTDVHSIADFIALVQAEKYCSFYNESLADAKGMLMQRLYRTLGLTAHLGWARLLLDRSRDLVDYPDATSNRTRKNNRLRNGQAILSEYSNSERSNHLVTKFSAAAIFSTMRTDSCISSRAHLN